MFKSEAKKLLSNKLFLFIDIILVIINFLFFYTKSLDRASGKVTYSPGAYRNAYKDIRGFSTEEVMNWLEQIGYNGKPESATPYYTDSSSEESKLLSRIYEDVKVIGGYREAILEIKNKFDDMVDIGMDSLISDYDYSCNKLKVEKHLANIDVSPEVGPTVGIKNFSDYKVTDLFFLSFILLAVVFLFVYERDNNQMMLFKTTLNGRKKLFYTKITVIFLFSFLGVLLFFGINLLTSAAMFGIGDVSRPIQSIPDFIYMPYKVSVSGYLVIFLAEKIIFALFLSTIFISIATVSANSRKFYFLSVIMFAVEILLYSKIKNNSGFEIFKMVNPVALMFTKDWFTSYRTVNIFNVPYSAVIVTLIVVIILIGILIYLMGEYFAVQKEAKIANGRTFVLRADILPGRHVSIFFHEIYKLMINGKTLIIIAVIMFLSIKSYKPVNEMFLIFEDKYERMYIEKLEGKINEEKLDYLEKEKERFEKLNAKLEELKLSAEIDEKVILAYQNQLQPYNSFMNVYSVLTPYIKECDGDYFRTTGYELLTGHFRSYDVDIKNAILMVVALIYPITFLFCVDCQYGVTSLVGSTKDGRSKKEVIRIIIGCALIAGVMFLIYSPEYHSIISEFGRTGFKYKAKSMLHLRKVPEFFSVGGYIAFIYLMRFVGFLIMMFVLRLISAKTKNIMLTLIIGIVIFLIPLLAALFGMDGAKYLGMNYLVLGNALSIY